MKNPLSYQRTEYDCGPTTMLNAIDYLFARNEIPPEVIKFVMLYCLDGYNNEGEPGKSGTTGMAMRFLSNWLTHYGEVKNWPISCEFLTGEQVHISQNSKLAECLQLGGVVIAKVMLGCWHYVLLTGMDSQYVYLFDPYYRKNPFVEKNIKIIRDAPKRWNRRITYDVLNSEGKGNYALGSRTQRECVLMHNKVRKQSMDSIEYMI